MTQYGGKAGPVCQNGEAYKEFFSFELSRPDDVAIVTRNAIKNFKQRLELF